MTMICAEIAQAHDGSLGNALAFIDAVADVGADAVKFQCHDGDENNTWRDGLDHPEDSSRLRYWERTALSMDHWRLLRRRAARRGIQFGVSVFSCLAEDRMLLLGVDFWKVPGHLHGQYVPVDDILLVLSKDFSQPQKFTGNDKCWYIHCSPERPAKADDVRPKRFDDAQCVGLSTHCPEIQPTLDFVRYWPAGAKYIEHHVCWDRRQFGPDTTSSITIDELALLVKGVREIEKERQCVSHSAK